MSQESAPKRALSIVVVFAFIRRGDEIVMVERALPPYAGTRTIPGGHKRLGEALPAACLREMEEETGLTLHDLRFAGLMQVCRGADRDALCVYYVADSFSGELRSSNEGPVFWADARECLAMKESHPALRALLPFIINNDFPFTAEAVTDDEGRGTYSVVGVNCSEPVSKVFE